jgi:SP family sugar:H+ symporter-like MFS transporter
MCNWGMSNYDDRDLSWRVTTGLQLAFAFFLLIGFIFSPESPRFLAKHERWADCRKNLANLRGLPQDDHEVDVELDEVRIKKEEDEKRGHPKYTEVFSTKDRILWRTMIGILVQVGQQSESDYQVYLGDRN